MKRALILTILLITLLFAPFGVISAHTPVLTLEDTVVEYSPDGYMPQAEVSMPELAEKIKYLAVDVSDSRPVPLPLTQAGEYRVKAYIDDPGYEDVSVTATIKVEPVQVSLSVKYLTEAYTSEPLMPECTVFPEWAAEYVSLDYSFIYFEEDDPSVSYAVDAPLGLGTYLTHISLGSGDPNFVCDGKTFIFTVDEHRGRRQYGDDALLPVDPLITCRLEGLTVTYDGSPHVPACECFPAVLEPQLTYRPVDYTGAPSAPATDPPVEPGEYEVTASVCGVELATGTLVISKIVPEFSLGVTEYEYTPDGVMPLVSDTSVPCTLIAYSVGEDDSVIEQVPLPLVELGRYLVVINPADTAHYESVYTLEYITVKKADVEINTASQTFVYDGFEKAIEYEVSPSWVPCEVRYYTLEPDGSVRSQLGTKPPINVGSYMATVHVTDTANVEPRAVSVYFSITDADSHSLPAPADTGGQFTFIGPTSPVFVLTALVLPLVLIAAFITYISMRKRGMFNGTHHGKRGGNGGI